MLLFISYLSISMRHKIKNIFLSVFLIEKYFLLVDSVDYISNRAVFKIQKGLDLN